MADQNKKTVILEFDVDVQGAIESIDSLTAANKELRKERNALNLTTTEGQKRAQELNAQIDSNTDKIKKNVSAIEQQKINIGNYKSALSGVSPVLGKVGEGLETGASGFKAMTIQALQFIATPIGAILAALVAVFALLKTAISSNNDVLDKFENVTNAIGIVVEIITNRIGKLGEALIALASGNFDEAINKTSEAFSGLTTELANAVIEGQRLLDMERQLEDAQRDLTVATAKQENVIKALVVQSKNRNLSFDESEAKIKQALKLEQQLVAERERLALKDLEITTGRIANTEKLARKTGESIEQFADRLRHMSSLSDTQVDGIIEKIVALETARGSSLAFQEKLENQLTALAEKRTEALKKQAEALALLQAQERAMQRAASEGVDTAVENPLTNAFTTQAQIRVDLNQQMLNQIAKQNEQFRKDQIEQDQRAAKVQRMIEFQKLDAAVAVADGISGLLDQQGDAYKAVATAQTLISTYASAQKAYEAAFLPIPTVASPALGVAYAAAAVLKGLANVAAINGIEFAEGGWTGPGSKYKVAGVVHADEYVTPKHIVNSAAAQPHLAALERMRLGGNITGYADGGLVTAAVSGPINQNFDVLNIIKNMPAPEVSVKEFTTVSNRVKVKEKNSKR